MINEPGIIDNEFGKWFALSIIEFFVNLENVMIALLQLYEAFTRYNSAKVIYSLLR